MNLIKRSFHRLFRTRKWHKATTIRTLQTERESRKNKEDLSMSLLRRRMEGWPEKEFSAAELAALPKWADIKLATCPLGTWIYCTAVGEQQTLHFLVHMVGQNDLLDSQWGTMSLPERGLNRYRIKVREVA